MLSKIMLKWIVEAMKLWYSDKQIRETRSEPNKLSNRLTKWQIEALFIVRILAKRAWKPCIKYTHQVAPRQWTFIAMKMSCRRCKTSNYWSGKREDTSTNKIMHSLCKTGDSIMRNQSKANIWCKSRQVEKKQTRQASYMLNYKDLQLPKLRSKAYK